MGNPIFKLGFTSSNSWCLKLMWDESCLRWVKDCKLRRKVFRWHFVIGKMFLQSLGDDRPSWPAEMSMSRSCRSQKEKCKTILFSEGVKIFGLNSKGQCRIPPFQRKASLNGCDVLISSVLSGPEARRNGVTSHTLRQAFKLGHPMIPVDLPLSLQLFTW